VTLGNDNNGTDGQTDRVRRNMRPPPREEGRIKSAQRDATLSAGCSKAEPKIFAPPQTAFPGARDGQNLISYRPSLVRIDARNFELSW